MKSTTAEQANTTQIIDEANANKTEEQTRTNTVILWEPTKSTNTTQTAKQIQSKTESQIKGEYAHTNKPARRPNKAIYERQRCPMNLMVTFGEVHHRRIICLWA